MSEDREQAGSPVEQDETTETQVLAAVERATDATSSSAQQTGEVNADGEQSDSATQEASNTETDSVEPPAAASSARPVIAASTEPPSAGAQLSAEEIFASHPPAGSVQRAALAGASASTTADPANKEAADTTETQAEAPAETPLPPVRDGEIRISSDHPMAALYMQTPMPPEIRGNRGAGVLIALLATASFAIVYAGVISLWLAPNYALSNFLSDGLLPWVLNLGFAAAALGFFIGFTVLVLIGGRAGWWMYVIFGLLVATVTWAAAVLGYALNDRFAGEIVSLQPMALLSEYGLIIPVIIAAIVAREVPVWFGAWVGARGRRMKRLNAESITEYESALAEARTQQP